jgi:nucleoid-associated protein EbfC
MPDFMGLMKQAAEIKSKVEALQAELDQIEVEGAAGGGLVRVTLTAKGDPKAVYIDASLLKPEEKEVIEDLLVAAVSDARRKGEVVVQEKMQAVTGGLPLQLPAGLKLF